jgi:hypothetical protein
MKLTNDSEIDSLVLSNIDEFSTLIVKYLCGEKYPREVLSPTRELICEIISSNLEKLITCPQLNEINKGISKFRCYSMLCYGNFKFAFQQLRLLSSAEIHDALLPFSDDSDQIEKTYTDRPEFILDIMHIEKDLTFLLGEIIFPKLSKELKKIDLLQKEKTRFSPEELSNYYNQVESLKDKVFPEVQKKGLINTDIYLTWDYMDIYIATSMRNKWEFEETYEFIENLFPHDKKGKNNKIANYNLRYFDPTQSKCSHSRDKGLIEGLMLKRVKCTIYMVQESDTFGKDSELASTLAQSNPVIAYVPQYSIEAYAEKVKSYPLEFFKKRLMLWKSEGLFKDPELIPKFRSVAEPYVDIIDNFLASSSGNIRPEDSIIRQLVDGIAKDKKLTANFDNVYNGFFKANESLIQSYLSAFDGELKENDEIFQFAYWEEKEKDFKANYKSFELICKLLAIVECYNFNKRADTLMWRHPLSVQIDINSGVANGLFVVRSAEKCIDLLCNILLNRLEFCIEHVKLFNISTDIYDTLSRISETIKNKFKHDESIQAIYQTKELSKTDIEALKNLSKKENLSDDERRIAADMQKFLENIEYEGVTILKENESNSPYRIITDNDKLANSFWNLYYRPI